MRNMSFSLTTAQMRAQTKFVTRRLGWDDLKAGDRVMSIEKGQGLKKGETVARICELEVDSNTPDRLNSITRQECALEGFPKMSPAEFVLMFCKANACEPSRIVYRIAFNFIGAGGAKMLPGRIVRVAGFSHEDHAFWFADLKSPDGWRLAGPSEITEPGDLWAVWPDGKPFPKLCQGGADNRIKGAVWETVSPFQHRLFANNVRGLLKPVDPVLIGRPDGKTITLSKAEVPRV